MKKSIKNQKFIKKSMIIIFSALNLLSPTFAMKYTKKYSTHITSQKIRVKDLEDYYDNPDSYEINDEIQIINKRKTDEIIKWIKNYNYSGDELCFYYLLSVTLKYFSKFKPNDTLFFSEKSYIYKYQDTKGYISFEKFKLCLIFALDKLR